MEITLYHYLTVGAILFSLGLFAMISRKNAIMILMGIELILNACTLNFIAFSKYGGLGVDGQLISVFVILLAVAEAAIALAIVLNIYNNFNTANIDEVDTMKD